MAAKVEANNQKMRAALLASALAVPASLDATNFSNELSLLSVPPATRMDTNTTLRWGSVQDPVKNEKNQDPQLERMLAILDEYTRSTSTFLESCLATIKASNSTGVVPNGPVDRTSLASKVTVVGTPRQPSPNPQPGTPTARIEAALRYLGDISQSPKAQNAVARKILGELPDELCLLLAVAKAQIHVKVEVGTTGSFRSEPYQFNLFSMHGSAIQDIRAQPTRPDPSSYLPVGATGGYDEFRHLHTQPVLNCEVTVNCDDKTINGRMKITSNGEVGVLQEIQRHVVYISPPTPPSPIPPAVLHLDPLAQYRWIRTVDNAQPQEPNHPLSSVAESGTPEFSLAEMHNYKQVLRWNQMLHERDQKLSKEAFSAIKSGVDSGTGSLGSSYVQAESAAQRFESYLLNRLGGNVEALSRVLDPEGLGVGLKELPRPSAVVSRLQEEATFQKSVHWLLEAKSNHEKRMTSLRERCQKL